MATDNSMSSTELIEQARRDLGGSDIDTVLEACEAFYMHGFADESTGDVDTFNHYYRVHRWIVETDSQGFRSVTEFDNEDEATAEFRRIDEEYASSFDDDEEEHVCQWGPVEVAHFTGNPHRHCLECGVVSLDLDEEEEE